MARKTKTASTPKTKTKTTRTTKGKAKSGPRNGPCRLFWHIVDWEGDFEPDDATRKGQRSPLAYVKHHLRGRGKLDRRQLDLQRQRLLVRDGGLEAYAVYQLCTLAAADRGEGRGYLYAEGDQPAGPVEIALQIGVGVKSVEKSLALLADLKFMEEVPQRGPLGDYRQQPGERAGEPPGEGREGGEKGQEQAERAEEGGVPDAAGEIPDAAGNRPDTAGVRPDTPGITVTRNVNLNLNGNLNGNGEQEPGTTDVTAHGDGECPGQQETATANSHENIEAQTGQRATGHTAAGPTSDPPKPNDNAPTETRDSSDPPRERGEPREREQEADTTDGEPPGRGKTKTPTATATGGPDAPKTAGGHNVEPYYEPETDAEADEPTVADLQQGAGTAMSADSHPAPAGSDCHQPKGQADRPPPGPCPPGIALDAEQMAARVYATIYPDAGAEQAAARHVRQRVGEFQAREMGSFASAWADVLSLGLPDVQIAALYQRAIKEGEATARKRIKPKKSRGAVWLYWLNKHMANMAGPGWKRGGNGNGQGYKRC